MVRVTVDVDACDVLEELDDETLRDELAKRKGNHIPDPLAERALLEKVWLHFRDRPQEAPQCLRDYLWDVLGKIL